MFGELIDITLKYLHCCLRSRKLWLPMDQKQQNIKAHLVLGSLIEMEDTEKSHIVRIMKVNSATITVAP
jgi:hypothetical protein